MNLQFFDSLGRRFGHFPDHFLILLFGVIIPFDIIDRRDHSFGDFSQEITDVVGRKTFHGNLIQPRGSSQSDLLGKQGQIVCREIFHLNLTEGSRC